MAETDKKIDKETGIETTGHTWDGIEELNNPLPRWWLWIFYATVAWSVLYVIAYPAIPLLTRATGGLFGWSTRGEVAQDIADFEASNAALRDSLVDVDLRVLEANEELYRYAVQAGAAVYRNNCSQCHGSGAAGAIGYPNLLDDAWLWGGTIDEIAYTVRHGIRNEEDADSRYSEMPAFGEILAEEEIDQLVQYVLAISGQDHDASAAAAAEGLFLDNCSACHGEEGVGMQDVGAPNLTDAIWLYGGDPETLHETLVYSRYGVMPPWGERLGEANVRAVAAYVHQLGGGEESPAEE
jgi:cytochrome c oxidase cbb3-type subunit 3